MNTELFIARRLVSDKENRKSISRSIVRIAVFGISLGLTVMIIAVSVVTGFKEEIRSKVIGFGAHIQIINFDSNLSFETNPVSENQDFYPYIDTLEGIEHIQVYATKAGIIKTGDNIEGVVLKGVSTDFNWSFFNKNIMEGTTLSLSDTATSNDILISKYTARRLELKAGDDIAMYFVQDPPRMRRLTIKGIYETSLEEFDRTFAIADIRHIQKLNNWEDDMVSGFEVFISNFDELHQMTALVREKAGFLFTEDGDKLRVINILDKYPQIFDWLELQNINVVVILALMLLVAGFNMVSGLLILILERTNMIGILKALGSNNFSIRKIFLYQSSFLIMRGLFWGNLIGIGLAFLQDQFKFIKLDQASYYIAYAPINLSFTNLLLLNLGTLIITVLMLLIPSMMISRISPEKSIKFN